MHRFISNIPGVSNHDIEFFTTDFEDSWVVENNKFTPFEESDVNILNLLEGSMSEDSRIDEHLISYGFHQPIDRLKRFSICRHGADTTYTNYPDYNKRTGKFENCEYLRCGYHGNCPYNLEGIMCQQMKVANGVLTHAELTYIRLTIEDLADKQIADLLSRSVNTIKKHRQNITRKLNVMRQDEISELIPEGNHSKKRHNDYEILLKEPLKILSNIKAIRSNP